MPDPATAPRLASAGIPNGPRPHPRRELPDHGEPRRYKYYGCKCRPCLDGWSAYQRHIARQKAYGRWHPFIPAEPIRRYVLDTLRPAGLGIRRIATLAGVGQSTITCLLYSMGGKPPTQQMKQATAAAVLSVRPGLAALADGAMIDATGTQRRLQALMAQGFTQSSLAPHLSMSPLRVGDILRHELVTARVARNAMATYDRLWDADPIDHGILPRVAVRTRNIAHREGYAPPLAWDDDRIDDPAAAPDHGSTANSPGATLAEIEWLLECGETDLTVIAARVGVTPAAAERALFRAERRTLGVAV